MALNILIAKHPMRVHRMQYTDEVVESGIQSAKCLGTEMVWLGPMRPAAVAEQDSFKPLEQLLVRNVKTIGPSKVSGLPSVAGAQPDVVTVGESHFNRPMRAEPLGVGELVRHPIMQITKTGFRILVWNSPFRSMLLVLQYGISNVGYTRSFYPLYNPD